MKPYMKKPIKNGIAYRPRIILAVMTACLLGCKGQRTAAEEGDAGSLQPLVSNTFYDTEDRTSFVINSQKELKTFYALVNRTRKPGLPVPSVDFNEHRVVVYTCAAADTVSHLRIADDSPNRLILREVGREKPGNPSQGGQVRRFIVYLLPMDDRPIGFQ